jgi:hypothetical protein
MVLSHVGLSIDQLKAFAKAVPSGRHRSVLEARREGAIQRGTLYQAARPCSELGYQLPLRVAELIILMLD